MDIQEFLEGPNRPLMHNQMIVKIVNFKEHCVGIKAMQLEAKVCMILWYLYKNGI